MKEFVVIHTINDEIKSADGFGTQGEAQMFVAKEAQALYETAKEFPGTEINLSALGATVKMMEYTIEWTIFKIENIPVSQGVE